MEPKKVNQETKQVNSEPKQVNLETMSLQELKALAYDILVTLQRDQQVLNQVNEFITKRTKEQEAPDGNK
jgi:ABC-type Na+ transport system ATPase subunit NatA